jgi:hypothetical protein
MLFDNKKLCVSAKQLFICQRLMFRKWDPQVCDIGILIKILCFWTLFVLFIIIIFFIWFVRLLALRPLLPIVPASGNSDDDCGEADGICRLAGETEVLGENLPQRPFCPSQNHTWPDPGLNPGRRGGKPATNRLSYGAAFLLFKTQHFGDWVLSPPLGGMKKRAK